MNILSFGAGVQSSTLLRMMIVGELQRADHVVFADTGWEPRAVYEHLGVMRKEAEAAGIPFHVVSNGNIRDDALHPTSQFGTMPLHVTLRNGGNGMGRRSCTSIYKLTPLQRKVRELVGLKPRQRSREHLANMVIGISWDEAHRMKDALYPWQRNLYPLVQIRMTRADCIEWNDRNGFKRPPRSSCIGCPFHSNEEWRRIKADPEAWEDACSFDEALRAPEKHDRFFQGRAYLHAKRIPLREVDLRTEEERGQGTLWGNECEGMCGL